MHDLRQDALGCFESSVINQLSDNKHMLFDDGRFFRVD